MTTEKYRLVTRSDFDGVVCAVLLRQLGLIDEIVFAHPKDMEDGKVEITGGDITANLPYVAGAHLVFDHHAAQAAHSSGRRDFNHIIDAAAPSSARVIYRHYGGKAAFPNLAEELIDAVDRADSAQYSIEDIVAPQGWALLSFIMDARTGLGRFKDFQISNYALMMSLIDYCGDHSIEEILALPDVHERVEVYRSHQTLAKAQIVQTACQIGNLVLLDLRGEEVIWATNRFLIYALFPAANVSVHVVWGLKKQNTVLACGKSILNRTSATHLGDLLLAFGGGGHADSATCQVDNDKADEVLSRVIKRINQDG